MQNVGIVGLGLIGGSLAKTIKLHTPYTVYGTDKNADTMRRAFLMEAIDGELTAETLPQCDVVLVCLYPQGIIDYVTAHAADFKPDSLVIDCGGVKQVICEHCSPYRSGMRGISSADTRWRGASTAASSTPATICSTMRR